MSNIRAFQRLLTPITVRIRRIIVGAIIKAVNDETDLQNMQIKTIGQAVYNNVEVFGQYGIACNPPLDLDAIAVERNGKYIVIAVGDRKYRIKCLESGDVCVYDMRNQMVKLSKDGITLDDVNDNHISMSKEGVIINGVKITQNGVVTTPGTITSGGDIKSGGDVISSTGKTMDTHAHDIGQTTSISGASTAGAPAIVATTTPPTK